MALSTRESIIALAENHIQQNGYNAFSYHDIAVELGIKNAAVHYHFPKKEDLLKAVIKKWERHFLNFTAVSDKDYISHLEQLERFLKIYDRNIDNHYRVCLVGAMATDLFTLPTDMRPQLNKLVSTMKGWLSEVLEKGRKAGEFGFKGSAADRAALVCSSMTGALQLARVLGKDEYEAIKSQLIKDIKK